MDNFKQAEFYCFLILNKQTLTLIINVVWLIKIIFISNYESLLIFPPAAKSLVHQIEDSKRCLS